MLTESTQEIEPQFRSPGRIATAPHCDMGSADHAEINRSTLLALQSVEELLLRREVEAGMDHLVRLLDDMHKAVSPTAWRQFVHCVFPTHSVLQFALRGPITRSAFEKRRGYPGDADTLDLIYGNSPACGKMSCRHASGRPRRCTRRTCTC